MERVSIQRTLDANDQFSVEVGQAVIDLFGLKEMEGHPGMYDTIWGRKTVLGVGRIVKRIARDPKNG